ncbi:hypothetical protein, partial [Microbacterium sp. B19]|uniref:hypothetical protein n=1 Tax=Microbacterium sp. B19 TaxID=96765 RepID=UPI00056C9BDE
TIDTVVGYLHRRRRSALPLTAGEAATLAVAVVRGRAAAPSRAAGAQWRITAEGRPVLVDEPGGDDVLEASVAVLDDLASLVPPDVRPGFARLRDALLTDPPPTWDTLERRLLAVIEPQPIVLGPLSPAMPDSTPPPNVSGSDAEPPPFLAAVRAALGRVRPRVLFAGVGAAVVVVVVAMMVTTPSGEPGAAASFGEPAAAAAPGGETPGAGADRREQNGAVSSRATPTAEPTDSSSSAAESGPATASRDGVAPQASDTAPGGASETTSGDLASAASAVLSSLAACTDDVCAAPLREAPADLAEPAPLDPRNARLDVIDDFGGLAVVRLTDGERAQYVTLVRGQDRWLVRSVRDVADQPS